MGGNVGDVIRDGRWCDLLRIQLVAVKPILILLLLAATAHAQRVELKHTEKHGAIVRVTCPVPPSRCVLGSGVLLDNRHLLTANHCIRGRAPTVRLPSGDVQADVIATCPCYDWALLRFRVPLTGVGEIQIRETPLDRDEWVFGYGFGMAKFGYTAARYKGTHVEGAMIEHGDSGGPVLDAKGLLCGVVTEADEPTINWRGHALASQSFRDFCALRFETFDNVKVVD